MKKLFVNAGGGYEIIIEENLLSSCGEHIKKHTSAKKVCVVSDTNVFPVYGDLVIEQLRANGFETVSYIFPAGEKSKTPKTVVSLAEFLAENEFTRKDLVVALGGGVCGDIAGFAAAFSSRPRFLPRLTARLAEKLQLICRRAKTLSARFTSRAWY